MAIYSKLPVYRAAYKLLLDLHNFTHTMPREFKYTLGERLKNESINLVLLIYETNRQKHLVKQHAIDRARKNIEIIRLLYRLCFDLKLCKLNTYVNNSEKIEIVSKQLSLWSKYIEQKPRSEPVSRPKEE